MTEIPVGHRVITSTADLTPAGLLGYAKGYVVTATLLIEFILPFLPLGAWQDWARWGLGILGALGVVAIPNQFKPLHVVNPPVDPIPR